MVAISVCSNCSGKGKYKIFNAYDPGFEEEIFCEVCDGTGVSDEEEDDEDAFTSKRIKDEDWDN